MNKPSCSSHHTVDRLIKNIPPFGRMGVFEHFWPETLRRWEQQGHYPFDRNHAPCCPAEFFNLDLFHAKGWIALDPFYQNQQVIHDDNEKQIIVNGNGATIRVWKNKSGTPEHLSFDMDSRKKWEEKYKPALLRWDENRIVTTPTIQELSRLKNLGKWSYFGIHFVWEQLRGAIGDVKMLESFHDAPEWIHDYNRTYTEFYRRYYTWIFEHVGKPDGIWIHEDIAYKNGLFCSPAHLEEFIFPYYREIVSFFHSHELPVLFHSDGKIEKIIPRLVSLGFRSLNPMDAKSGCDVVDFAEKFGEKIAFFGGMDVRILESGDLQAIQKEVIRITSAMRRTGARYIFGSDHSIPPSVHFQSYQHALECFRDHAHY
ncbi:uroporphyrinogen decarboxylase family protein [Kamptonema cortianum]|nr:uroporphyrinogen decarboxylase family protein [Kamptonema cortianum]MDL5044506.1 uroporphyrinogen decarboxylase family protein [Oscillatoria amoena NRMC-F 0135]